MRNKRSDGQQTRKKLLEAAGELFANHGFRGTTVADICKAASANVAAVNYYFGSKEELYAEAWRHLFEVSIAKYPPDGGVDADAPAEERFRGSVTSLLHRILDPACRDFDIVDKEMANPTGLLSDVIRQCIEPLRMAFQSVIRELLGPKATEEQVQLCAWSIRSECMGMGLHSRKGCPLHKKDEAPMPKPIDFGFDTLAAHVTRFCLAGIQRTREQNGEA